MAGLSETAPAEPLDLMSYLINLDKYPLSDDLMQGIQERGFPRRYTINVDSPDGFVEILSQCTQMSVDIRTGFIEWLQVVTHSNAGSAVNSSTSPVYDFSILLPVATKQPTSPVAYETEENMLVSYGETTTSQQNSSTVLNPDHLTEFSTLVPTAQSQIAQTTSPKMKSPAPVISHARNMRKRTKPDNEVAPRRSSRIKKVV